MVNRQVSGAHYGVRDWLAQRATAVVMVAYTALFVIALVSLPALDFQNWQGLWSLPLMKYATLLFFAALMFHAWVGIRNVCMDYIKDSGLRLTLYVLVILALLAYGAWTIQILWGK